MGLFQGLPVSFNLVYRISLNHQGVFTLRKASCASCSGETAELTPRFRDTTAPLAPYLDPNLSVQWSLDGEVTPLWSLEFRIHFSASLHCTLSWEWDSHGSGKFALFFFWVVCLLVCAWQPKKHQQKGDVYIDVWWRLKTCETKTSFFGPCLFASYIFNDWHCGIWDIKWNPGLLKINHQPIGIKKGGLPELAVSSTCKTLHLFFLGGDREAHINLKVPPWCYQFNPKKALLRKLNRSKDWIQMSLIERCVAFDFFSMFFFFWGGGGYWTR